MISLPHMDTKKFYIKTYGCQMNIYDSSRMKALLDSREYLSTKVIEEADIIILNTCNIREKATEKVYSDLGRIKKMLKKQKRQAIVIVSGCVAQAEGKEIFKRAPWVQIVVGPQAYHKLLELIDQLSYTQKYAANLSLEQNEKFGALPLSQDSSASAFITIQEGCNRFCKYCTVPYTRGREFSRPIEDIYQETLRLVSKGAVEIFLLGQNVNAYCDVSGDKNRSLLNLIKEIASIERVQRIRYMTSHPVDMTDDLIAAHGSIAKLMPQLHLPVQSGSDTILKAMNRRHTAKKYLETIDKLKRARPDICISSDIIVGYPGETEEDFQDTLALIESVKFSQVYSFKYSPRSGTPAATLSQIPEEIKDQRLQRLQALTRIHQREFNTMALDKTLEVLLTNKGKLSGQLTGFSQYLHSVVLDNTAELLGKIVPVKINKILSNSLKGDIVTVDLIV